MTTPSSYQLSVQSSGTGGGSITSSPAGISCGSTCSATFQGGTTVTLTAAPNASSTFAGWSGACSGTGTCSVNLTGNTSVTATFNTATTTQYQLSVQTSGSGSGTVTSSPAGINCGSACSASFNSGTSVTLTAAPNASSTFAGWSGGCSGTGTCTVTLNSNTTVTAMFNTAAPAQSTLSIVTSGTGGGTVTSSPTGINCGTTCSASFTNGTAVTLTAAPNGSSIFAGWSGGGCSGTTTCAVTLNADTTVTATFNAAPPPSQYQLTVMPSGSGTGTVTSSPTGITCGTTCSANFDAATSVTLTAKAGTSSTFAGWSGAGCSGTGPCVVDMTTNNTVTATFNPTTTAGLSSINHIIFLAQENRSFDQYFGALRGYWKDNGYADESFDGLNAFNPTSGPAPLYDPNRTDSNPGCDPTVPGPSDCKIDTSNPVTSYHLQTVCTENTSPTWDEAHVDWNYGDQLGLYNDFAGNGFVYSAAHDTRGDTSDFPKQYDANGIAAMGYYDGSDLNYYYYMASNFATSDRWFHPVMSRTDPNREYLIAATSQGRVYPNGAFPQDAGSLTAPVIFQELQAKGITWKIYVDTDQSGCADTDTACLVNLSYVSKFTFAQTLISQYPNNIAPLSQFATDAANGNLAQVVQIEPAIDAGLDEHGSNNDTYKDDIQLGAQHVESLITSLMNSQSWKDSAFILTYDESGGLYDHVAPQPAASPDGIKPVDLQPDDVCTTDTTAPLCDFTWTGYRVPLIVVSPFAKQHYVSHTVMDTTAILKLIETRFNVPALTKRDAAQPDMTEFFDFNNPPWMTPPSNIPAQNVNGTCDLSKMQ